jgi:outer membrane protein assembly factor BamB
MISRWLSWLVLVLLAGPTLAADWPQWQGPERNNISKETGLLKTWPQQGPRLVWTFENAGVGFSSPAVVGDKLYALGARDRKEMLYCIDIKTGKEVWGLEFGTQFDNGWGDGPRSTPTVDGNLIFGLGGQGDLFCADTSGKMQWQKSMQKDLAGKMMSGWGYSESPLVDGDKLIVTPGGNQGTLAALDKKTGKVLWRSKGTTDAAAYSSCIVAESAGIRQYINLTGNGVVGVSAKDGEQLWYHRQEGYRTAVCPTPIFANDHVYATADYGAGCDLLKLIPDGGKFNLDVLYTRNKGMENHHGGVVLLGDHIYGCSGNSNARAKWVCQDLKSARNLWSEEKLDPGSLICADGLLYLYGQKDGTCVLVEPSPAGWKENGRFKIPALSKLPRKQGKIWTHPVVANGRLFLRDEELLFCFDIRVSTAGN